MRNPIAGIGRLEQVGIPAEERDQRIVASGGAFLQLDVQEERGGRSEETTALANDRPEWTQVEDFEVSPGASPSDIMAYPQLASTEQDISLRPAKSELEGVEERTGVGVVVVRVRRQQRTAWARRGSTSGGKRADRNRRDEKGGDGHRARNGSA
jgi:hypothetical protein